MNDERGTMSGERRLKREEAIVERNRFADLPIRLF